MRAIWVIPAVLCFLSIGALTADPLPYQNPDLPFATRAADLVSRLTLSEKISQIVHDPVAIQRLGIPKYRWANESIHGVTVPGVSTVFPQVIGLAASWDPGLLRRVANAISDEGRAKHHEELRKGCPGICPGLNFWAPNVNIFRDPRWGRGQETYGEDPFLTSQLSLEYVRGIQGDDPHYLKAIATPKHFAVHSGPEFSRNRFDAQASAKDLAETYLPTFEALVREGQVGSVMASYNRINGVPAVSNRWLLGEKLRKEWGFDGYVVSDCHAISNLLFQHHTAGSLAQASAQAVKAGTDLDCGHEYLELGKAVTRGMITEKELDPAVRRVFEARMKLGLFDPAERVPFANIPPSVIDSPAHRALAREAAARSLVLLKNQGGLLPLRRDLKKIAVIGPLADATETLLGNYHGTPSKTVSPLEAIRARFPGAQILHEKGSELEQLFFRPIPQAVLGVPGGSAGKGLEAQYFANASLSGSPKVTRVDARVDMKWYSGPPAAGVPADNFSVRWTGRLFPRKSGDHHLALNTDDGARLWLDGKLLVDQWSDHAPLRTFKRVRLEAGKSYTIKIEYYQRTQDALARLEWVEPSADLTEGAVPREAAAAAARQAEVALVFLGINTEFESEGLDRERLELPEAQLKLLQAVQATGTPVVLTLMSGSPVLAPWAQAQVRSIIQAWYPGEEGGNALVDALIGDINPAGRLPLTYPASTEDLPALWNYSMEERGYRFASKAPLYPFGHGLSYTEFRYSNLELARAQDGSVLVTADLTNIGNRAGDEVPQLYLESPALAANPPKLRLRGFSRIGLEAGQTRSVHFELPRTRLAGVDDQGVSRVVSGTYRVYLGGRLPGPAPEGAPAEPLSASFVIQ